MRRSYLAVLLLSAATASWAEPAGDNILETITCRTAENDPFGECQAIVARARGGEITLKITAPGGLRRIIHNRDGVPLRSDARGRVEYERNRDTLIIRIGRGEVYEVPDRLVLFDRAMR